MECRMNELQNYERASDIIFSNLSNFYEETKPEIDCLVDFLCILYSSSGIEETPESQLITSFCDIPFCL